MCLKAPQNLETLCLFFFMIYIVEIRGNLIEGQVRRLLYAIPIPPDLLCYAIPIPPDPSGGVTEEQQRSTRLRRLGARLVVVASSDDDDDRFDPDDASIESAGICFDCLSSTFIIILVFYCWLGIVSPKLVLSLFDSCSFIWSLIIIYFFTTMIFVTSPF